MAFSNEIFIIKKCKLELEWGRGKSMSEMRVRAACAHYKHMIDTNMYLNRVYMNKILGKDFINSYVILCKFAARLNLRLCSVL